LWHRLSQAPAKPACDRIVREIAKPWHSNSLWVSRQKLASYISAEPAPPAGDRTGSCAAYRYWKGIEPGPPPIARCQTQSLNSRIVPSWGSLARHGLTGP
jgi:hypothetical protein